MPANTSRLFKLHVHCGRAVGPWKSFLLFTRYTPKKQHNLSSLACRARVYFRVSISTASSAFFGFQLGASCMMPSTLDLYALRHFSLLCTRGYQTWIPAIYPVLHLSRSHQSLRFCASRVLFLVLGRADPKFKVLGLDSTSANLKPFSLICQPQPQCLAWGRVDFQLYTSKGRITAAMCEA